MTSGRSVAGPMRRPGVVRNGHGPVKPVSPNAAPTKPCRNCPKAPANRRGPRSLRLIWQGTLARNFHRAEARQMFGQELGVEQLESAELEARHQMDERNLAGVGLAREHALAEERAAQPHAVKPADQAAFAPAFERMGVVAGVQRGVEAQDFVVDPGLLRSGAARRRPASRRRTRCRGDDEFIAAHRARQPLRDMEGVQREDAALLRRHPIERGIVAPLRHREQPLGIGARNDLRREARECMGRVKQCGVVFTSLAAALVGLPGEAAAPAFVPLGSL